MNHNLIDIISDLIDQDAITDQKAQGHKVLNANDLAKEIYNLLIRELEKEIKKAKKS